MTENIGRKYSLDIEQKTAVKNALKNNLSIITGFPGTGKSSIVQCILYVLNTINKDEINKEYDSVSEDEKEESEKVEKAAEERKDKKVTAPVKGELSTVKSVASKFADIQWVLDRFSY
jgi:broad-specificity NMP kinase